MNDYRSEKVHRLMRQTSGSPELQLALVATELCGQLKKGDLTPEETELKKGLVKTGILQVLRLVAPPGVGTLIGILSKGAPLGVEVAAVAVGSVVVLGLIATLAKVLKDARLREAEGDDDLPEKARVTIKDRLERVFESEETEAEGVIRIRREAAVPTPEKAIDLQKVRPSVASAIAEASRISGLAPSVIYAIANKESRLGKFNAASTSSARGLLQIVRGTWNELVGRYGDKYNIGPNDYDDDRASAIMGSLYLRDLAVEYKRRSGESPTITELYMLYMLGMRKGMLFFSNMQDDPTSSPEDTFAREAKANPSVFYTRTPAGKKTARSYLEVYRYLRDEVETVEVSTERQLRSSGETAPAPRVESTPSIVQGTRSPTVTVTPLPAKVGVSKVVFLDPHTPIKPVVDNSSGQTMGEPPRIKLMPQTAVRTPSGLVVGVY